MSTPNTYVMWVKHPHRDVEPQPCIDLHDVAQRVVFHSRHGSRMCVVAVEHGEGGLVDQAVIDEAVAEFLSQPAPTPLTITHHLYMRPPNSSEFVLADKATSRKRIEDYMAAYYPGFPADRYEIREAQ